MSDEQTGVPDAVPPSDADRDAVVARLTASTGTGKLTLAEFDQRAHRAYAATSAGELASVTADLPEREAAPVRRRPARRWAVALFGGSTVAGRWRLDGSLRSVALFGGNTLDLRGAELDGDEVTITSVALFGGDDVYVPAGVDVSVTGLALFGGNDEHGAADEPPPGAPAVRIRTFALFGGSDVYRVPSSAMSGSLKQIRKESRKALPG